MHGFYFAKSGATWVQLATNTSRPFDEIQYPPPEMTVPIALATAAGVTPDRYLGTAAVYDTQVPQYKEGSACFLLDHTGQFMAQLIDQNTQVAVDLIPALKAAMAVATGDPFASANVYGAVFQAGASAALFWQDLDGCTEVP